MLNSEKEPASPPVTSWGQLQTIDQSDFALQAPKLDRAALQRTLLDEGINLAYSDPCPASLLEGLAFAVDRAPQSFYSMFEVTRANVSSTIKNWLAGDPLGQISHELANALQDDICTDVCRFILATGSRSVTLRMVLERESGCEKFLKLLDDPMEENYPVEIEKIIGLLEYGASFLLHCDEDMVNQIKSYVGAPTIAVHHTQIRADPTFDHWFDIFRGGNPTLAAAVENALATADRSSLALLGRQLEMDIAKFQLDLPDLGKPGEHPLKFLPGRQHLYFGALNKVEGNLGFNTPKGLLHARPAIWSSEPGAVRFMSVMDSNADIRLEDLLGN